MLNETVRFAGSPMKYSISEEHHNKGFLIIELDAAGQVSVEKRELKPKHDMRTVVGTMEDILLHPVSEDYVFVKLLDETPVLFPMEKVRSVYPNAMHVERKVLMLTANTVDEQRMEHGKHDDLALFKAFYEEMKGEAADVETETLFSEVLHEVMHKEGTEL